MKNLDILKAQIAKLESSIEDVQSNISAKQSEIDNFEYECSDDEFSDWIDSIYPEVSVGSLTFSPSEIMKELDPIAYRCGKSDYESNYDLDDCEEYTTLKDKFESLENELEDLESELSDLTDELEELQDET